MRRQLLLLAALSAALCACCVHCLRPVIRLPRDAASTGRYIAVLEEDTSHARLLEIVQFLRNLPDGCVVYGYMEVATKAIVLDMSDSALQKFRNIPEVAYIEEEGLSYATGYGSSGDADSALWYLDRIDQLPVEGEGVDVYILDSGIMFQHHEFGHRAKYAGYDPVDQYEFEIGTQDYTPRYGADCHGHGTAVASLVGGEIYGKARKANLYSVRVLRCDTTAPWSVVLDGLNFVAEIIPKRGQNAIVLLALSGSNSAAINKTIEALHRENVVVITAAGNDGINACFKSLASSPYVITVGSTDRYDNIAPTSNYGSCVDLFAPGEDILAASNRCDSCSDAMSGTTLSAALTAGVVAVYLSQYPYFTPALIRERLLYQTISGVIDFTSIPENEQAQTPNRLLNRGCGGIISVSVSEEGVLESPNFPKSYPGNMKCKWTLIAERDCDAVKINFTHIILEENYDTLTVCPQKTCHDEEKIILTGDYGTPDCVLQSEGQFMTLEFETDSFTEGPGFRATHIALFASTATRNNRCSSSSIKSTIQLDVYSAGNEVGNRFSIKKGWKEFFAGRKSGINIGVIDEVNGSVITTENFKTHTSSSDSTQLGVFIEKVAMGNIVCVAVSYDGVKYLDDYGKRSLMWLGSHEIQEVSDYESWALIGVKGALPGQAVEAHGTSPVQLSARVHLKPFRQYNLEVTAESAGRNYGKYATITVNHTVIDIPYEGHDRGLHVLVLSEVTGEILHRQVFDTSAESGAYSSSDQFIELIDSLPKGRIVAAAIKEEVIDHLSEQAKQACESIGSSLIRTVHHEGSWAIIGRKGAATGSVPESAKNNGISKSVLLKIPDSSDTMCSVSMQSLYHEGSGNSITLNGSKTIHLPYTDDGNLIALLNDGECSVERNMTFKSSDDLSNFIKYIPTGRTVVVNIAYNYRGLTDTGNDALEAIGSARVRSMAFQSPWAIIGKKGAPKGSAIEYSFNGEGKALETLISLHSVNTTISIVLVQAGGSSLGNYAKIGINGEEFTMPSVYESGLNVLLLDEYNTSIHHVHTFNMTASNSSQDIELFVNLTESLPVGSAVAMATNDAIALNQSDDVKETLVGFGSRYLTEAADGGSWAMIGRKGALQGSVLEATSNDGPVEIVTHTLPVIPVTVSDNETCSVFVESAGTGSIGGRQLTINNKPINTSLASGDGIRIAVMKNNSCELESLTTYATHYHYTHSNILASSIRSIPAGRIVIASVCGSGRESNPNYGWYHRKDYSRSQTNLQQALESIGSALFARTSYRDAWAIIGRKGAAQGSVPESFTRSRSHLQSSAVAVGGVIKLNTDLKCKNDLYPIDCLLE